MPTSPISFSRKIRKACSESGSINSTDANCRRLKIKTRTLEKAKRKMSKVIFGDGDGVPESILRDWETMHRPPDTIPTSGPHAQRGQQLSRAGLVVPPTVPHKGTGSRRHSVISSPKDNVGAQFPLRPSATTKSSKGSKDPRRISEAFAFDNLCKSHFRLYVR